MSLAAGRIRTQAGARPASRTSVRARPSRIVGIPATGLALGLAVVSIEGGGVASRPTFGFAILLLGLAAGMLPLNLGLPIAVVMAEHQEFFVDFIGGYSRYWKEGFVLVITVRAFARRPPDLLPAGVGLLCLTPFLGYLLAGSPTAQVAWAIKILLMFVVLGWAVAQLSDRGREWQGMFTGLAVGAASNAVIAVWQHTVGVNGLLRLGLVYGQSVRQVGSTLRIFGAFNYSAPYAYTMAFTALAWFALVLSRRERRAALGLAWLPGVCLLGIFWSLNRVAFVSIAAAMGIMAVRQRAFVTTALFASLSVAVAILAVGSTGLRFLSQGFFFRGNSAQDRLQTWGSRWAHVSAFGHGPGTAGSAFDKTSGYVYTVHHTPDLTGVVDNLYLSWLYQYGVFLGLALSLIWIVVLLRLVAAPHLRQSLPIACALLGIFFMVAGISVSVWEEFPLDMLLAVVLGLKVAHVDLLRGRASARRRASPTGTQGRAAA